MDARTKLEQKKDPGNPGLYLKESRNKELIHYFFIYITSFTSFTVRVISGMASAARFGA